uniref:ADP,ATP carrier protein n=1 Tax=Pseudictyota dubia TaxID=2749911 RepID=A0A7R9VC99_9STRA|mmetsp:Transcript_10750/g.20508  ORF Transcript_10750/g.20508 Transcript_10750/m.20508 type:complete len:522 (+) Transcript_10750:165-1730(+)
MASRIRGQVDVGTTLHLGVAPSASASDVPLTFADAAMRRVLPGLTPALHASVLMALSMASHFFGYEFARSSNLSSFTSKGTSGFGSDPGAFPLAMACVSPFSVLLLLGYGRELDLHGPRTALRKTTLFCSAALSATALLSSAMERLGVGSSVKVRLPILGYDLTPARAVVWASFVFQNSYAHLLYAQQWSFIGSILTSEEGATWFASFAGLSSISSTIAGTMLSRWVETIGLNGLLVVASLGLIVTAVLADVAYDMSERHGFDPAEEIRKKEASKKESIGEAGKEKGKVQEAVDLFRRVPILGALFWEVISFQSLSTILNVCFVTRLKEVVTDDALRAAWTGKFYSYVNGASGLLQFLILPLFMSYFDPSWVYRLMPLAPFVCTFWTAFQDNPSLYLVAFSFFAAKVIDYTLRNVVNEMIYVPLDFDSRYKGKEIIGVFGSRFGKSGMSLLLSGLTYMFGSFGIQELARLTAVASTGWWACTYRLSNLIPNRSKGSGAKKKKDGIAGRRGRGASPLSKKQK